MAAAGGRRDRTQRDRRQLDHHQQRRRLPLVKVKVGVNFKFILGFMPANQMAFTGTSENVVHE